MATDHRAFPSSTTQKKEVLPDGLYADPQFHFLRKSKVYRVRYTLNGVTVARYFGGNREEALRKCRFFWRRIRRRCADVGTTDEDEPNEGPGEDATPARDGDAAVEPNTDVPAARRRPRTRSMAVVPRQPGNWPDYLAQCKELIPQVMKARDAVEKGIRQKCHNGSASSAATIRTKRLRNTLNSMPVLVPSSSASSSSGSGAPMSALLQLGVDPFERRPELSTSSANASGGYYLKAPTLSANEAAAVRGALASLELPAEFCSNIQLDKEGGTLCFYVPICNLQTRNIECAPMRIPLPDMSAKTLTDVLLSLAFYCRESEKYADMAVKWSEGGWTLQEAPHTKRAKR